MAVYTLMNKNIALASINMAENGYIVELNKVHNAEAFPVGVAKDSSKETLAALNSWWHGRYIPASRDGLKQLLHLLGVESASQLALRSFGLSLSDQYWIKPDNVELTWENVNFFTNDFSKELGEAFFNNASANPSINPQSPDASSNGWLKKKWVIIDGKRYLAKAGSVPLLQQPYNEVAASKICDLLGFEHVDYKLVLEHNRPLSLCPNFITAETEFVPASSVKSILPKSNNDSEWSHLLLCADKLGIPDVEEFLQKQLVLDFLIENTDRHYGNFGFIRDVNTLQFLGVAPIFDNGTSLWCDSLLPEIGAWQQTMPFKKNHKEQIKLVKDINLDADLLRNIPRMVRDVLSSSEYLEQNRVERIAAGVENRVRLLSLG